jgi:hypothetical protein
MSYILRYLTKSDGLIQDLNDATSTQPVRSVFPPPMGPMALVGKQRNIPRTLLLSLVEQLLPVNDTKALTLHFANGHAATAVFPNALQRTGYPGHGWRSLRPLPPGSAKTGETTASKSALTRIRTIGWLRASFIEHGRDHHLLRLPNDGLACSLDDRIGSATLEAAP